MTRTVLTTGASLSQRQRGDGGICFARCGSGFLPCRPGPSTLTLNLPTSALPASAAGLFCPEHHVEKPSACDLCI